MLEVAGTSENAWEASSYKVISKQQLINEAISVLQALKVARRGNALRVLALILAPVPGICCDLSATAEAKVPV
jgi:hypothetical protein